MININMFVVFVKVDHDWKVNTLNLFSLFSDMFLKCIVHDIADKSAKYQKFACLCFQQMHKNKTQFKVNTESTAEICH